MEALNNGRIGVCKWIESGTTLDSAVPELSELTNDKEDWRAIIVRFEDGELMSGFESDARNPYDFKDNAFYSGKIEESKNPLIRLTQMLGGVPSPEIKFESEVIIEDGKNPRTIYKPVVDLEANQKYRELCRKYEYDGKLPSSIVVISIRQRSQNEATRGDIWTNNQESNSSDFWKRNKYPSNCRFLVYDFEKQGPIQRDADEFGFWMSTLLVSSNDIDSSTLQAYRLYTVKPVFDKPQMEEVFRITVNRLCSARKIVEKDIKRDIELQLATSDTLPDYKMEVSVAVDMPEEFSKRVNPNSFGVFSAGVNTELEMWRNANCAVEEQLAECVRSAERTLDKTADKMKPLCMFSEGEVSNLDKYQIEDMTRETGELYNKIVKIQGILPSSKVTTSPSVVSAMKNVKEFLLGRMSAKSALGLLALIFILLLLSGIPGIVRCATESKGSLDILFAIIGVVFGVVAIVALIVILVQKSKLNSLIGAYNQQMKNLFNNIISNADQYSAYLSSVASHSRGLSYLNLSKRKKVKIDELRFMKYAHVKNANIILAQMRNWSRSYHLNVDFDNPSINERMAVNMSESPFSSNIYTFEHGDVYSVLVNNSGEQIESPFSFVKKLEITREELYDDGSI